MKSYKNIICIIGIITITLLCGCGKKDEELDTYYSNMKKFVTNITKLGEKLDNLDPNKSSSTKTMLKTLDSMELTFKNLADCDVPAQFASNETLADEAYEYMHEAVTMYHSYFENPETDINTADAAYENYTRAMKRVEYISMILQGNMPEGEDVEVTNEETTDFAPVTEEN